MEPTTHAHTLAAFTRLETLFGGSLEQLPEATKSESGPYMDLHFDRIGRTATTTDIALAHYFKMNGDQVSDPDMVIRIHHAEKRAEALSFQDQFRYHEVYDHRGVADTRQQRSQNEFLHTWLGNCIQQGHSFRSAP